MVISGFNSSAFILWDDIVQTKLITIDKINMPSSPPEKNSAEAKSFDMNTVDDRLSAMYTNDQDKEQSYDQWANKYDSDLVNDLNYVAHIEAARIFNEMTIDKHARVLDVACGVCDGQHCHIAPITRVFVRWNRVNQTAITFQT